MTLVIRRIALDNFRKFRAPVTIDGLAEGLNIVIEPNEAGKSTLLEALRAAFFVRHSTRNQLASSYAPTGENVAPEVEVTFDLGVDEWTVKKRFLRSPSVEVRGPDGRTQGDAAEEQLQRLLGFERDNSRTGDVSAHGALGLLWVAQTEGLAVAAPSSLVRNSVHSILEAEVGSIMSGAAYDRVRARIDQQYSEYWTATGMVTGKQRDAAAAVERTDAIARDAATRLDALERSFAELDAARLRLKLLEKELEDDTDAKVRLDLEASLQTARAAALLLGTRRAEHAAATANVRALEELRNRHEAAVGLRATAEKALELVKDKRAALTGELAKCREAVESARASLTAAREARLGARQAVTEGEASIAADAKRGAIIAALARNDELAKLEQSLDDARQTAATLVPAETIERLEAHERAIAKAEAELAAGATHIALIGETGTITIDGEPMLAGERVLTRETRIGVGDDAVLVIRPPATSGSAEAILAAAVEQRRSALEELAVDSLAAARARNDAAREAAAEVKSLVARIEALTPADSSLGIAAGPEALKLFVSMCDVPAAEDGEGETDIDALRAALEEAETALARAEGRQESALEALSEVEGRDKLVASEEAGANSDLQNASRQVEENEARPRFQELEDDLANAAKVAAGAAVKLEDAERDAKANDVAEIERSLKAIDDRASAALEARQKLQTEIARLEGTVESEGGKGLAEQSAVALEEAEAATKQLARVTEEAETLKLLRATLEEARAEASRAYVGPVAARAKRHIERLLPDCDLKFSDELGLESVTRRGVVEDCDNLSRGTQEQLAVLTRLAFADMLLDQGQPVSLILDDPLAYSDDARLDIMTDVLRDAATRMQVILLTCRDRAFRHVEGNRVDLRVDA